jgi:hypothetical protein
MSDFVWHHTARQRVHLPGGILRRFQAFSYT